MHCLAIFLSYLALLPVSTGNRGKAHIPLGWPVSSAYVQPGESGSLRTFTYSLKYDLKSKSLVGF